MGRDTGINSGSFSSSPLAALAFMAEFGTAVGHIRNMLGDQTYESLAHHGAAMTTAAIVTYAFTKSTRPE